MDTLGGALFNIIYTGKSLVGPRALYSRGYQNQIVSPSCSGSFKNLSNDRVILFRVVLASCKGMVEM